ncbi:tetratricopeptide repeat protein, partial [bacterium]|nr:tetratricopeptide repeat protein [bacterium]
VWLGRAPRPSRLAIAALAVAVVVFVPAVTLPGMMNLYATKVARGAGSEKADVALVLEGRAATVTVFDQWDPGRGAFRDMYLNGVEEASTRYWHAQLFKLLGILPVMLHEPSAGTDPGAGKETAVIAFGAGITAGSVLASDEVASLDVVDLNPDIEGINDCFTDVNGDVFHKERFHFQNDDGRNYLVTCNKSYDVIISDSTHPRAYDSWILYTEEFYRAVQRRLRPGGIFAQWVPVLGSMQGELFRIHLNTFRTVFPNTTFWYVYGSDQAFLLAMPEPLAIDAPRLQEKLDRLPEWFAADHYQIDTVARVAGFFWMGPEAMDRMIAGETRVNTDDFHYFDKQSTVRPLPPQWRLPMFQASALPFVRGGDDALAASIRSEQNVAGLLGRFGFFRSDPDLHRAWCADSGNNNVRYWMSVRNAGVLPEGEEFCRQVEIDTYRGMLAVHPDDPIAQNALADALAAAGQYAEARQLAEQALESQPENGMILDTYGWILHGQGETARALEVLHDAERRLGDHPIVLYHLGATYDAAGKRARARDYLRRALEKSPSFPGAQEARALLDGAGREGAGAR